ncbi:hypothetical protein BDQ17DRAFT_1426098 [Cyathus striatus]|nr:hypothetical protein BDQ17DRAFT_1426098 [Cyathus striatus]
MFIPLQPYLPWKIAVTIIHVIAILAACLRIEHRRRSRRIWWDDYASVLPALLECLNLAVQWARMHHFSDKEQILYRHLKVELSLISSVFCAAIGWWSRISMALTIMRITPEWSKSRVVTFYVIFAFILNWMGLLIAFTTICTLRTSWQLANTDVLICTPAFVGSTANISTEITGDVLLTALPLYRLWNLRLPLAQRRLVRLVFSTSLLPLAVSGVLLIFTYGNFMKGPGSSLVWIIMLQVEVAMSVIASHLTVLISWGYKAFIGDADIDAESNNYINPH